MKLYYSPGACSLASHIALLEAGLDFELERVDLKSKLTETGADFTAINTKGYVPALVLDSGDVVTENIAVLDWIASQSSDSGTGWPAGAHATPASAGLHLHGDPQELQAVLHRRR